MRRLYKYAWVAFAGTLMAISCNKTMEEPASSEDALAPVTRTFTCVYPGADDPDAKVSLDADGKTGWEVGDKIFVHGNHGSSTYSKVITLGKDEGTTISANKKSATFTVELTDLNDSYNAQVYVAYPADAVKNNWDAKPYLYYTNRFNNTNAHLLTGYNDKREGTGSTLHFYNLCACISFIVDGDFDGYVFKGNAGETVGYSTYQVRFDTSYKKYAYIRGDSWCDDTSGPLTTISVSGWTGADGSTLNKIYIPYEDGGVKAFPNGFTIQFLKDGNIVKQVSTSQNIILSCDKSNDYKPKYMKLGNITSALKNPPVSTTHDSSIGVPAQASGDLSATATANSYIVDPAKYAASTDKLFKFKAVKGNNNLAVLSVKSVEILWETYNDATDAASIKVLEAVDYDQQEGEDPYIVFQMPASFHAGNAVIAAKNAGGNIIWSWHIWVPSSAVTSSQYGLEGQTWLDRNLGALTVTEASETVSNPQSFGFFYCWGRKDPIPSLASFDASTLATTTGTFVFDGGLMSIDDTYSSPMTFPATGDDSHRYWTLAAEDANGLWATSKTINDPCPPGYVVPQFTNTSPWVKKPSSDPDPVPGFEVSETYKWFKMGSGSYVVFPIVGFFDACQSKGYHRERGNRTLIWSSTNTSDAGLSYAMRVNKNGTRSIEWERQARGFSVRCVAE